MNTTQHQHQDRSQLFLVRLWAQEGLDNEDKAWQGKLQHLVSGASWRFDGLSNLPEALEKMIEQEEGSPDPDVREASLG